MKELGKFLHELISLIKLETMTVAGRVNLSSLGLLVLFIVAYTTNDMLCYLISAARDAIKTFALKENISDPYETITVFKVMIPIIALAVFCLFFLYYDDKKKKEIDRKKNDAHE